MSFFEIIFLWIGIAIISLIYLLFKPAPYGRYAQPGWGPMISSKFAWLFMESPVFIIMLGYFIIYYTTTEPPNSWLIILFLLHYFNRSFIYPFQLKSKTHKMPLTVVLSAVAFNLVNGNILGYYFTIYSKSNVPPEISWTVWLGITLFFVGLFINLMSDRILAQLRSEKSGYFIPEGWLYQYIACPNYLGELIEWFGFALAAGHLAAWSFFIWTFANLVPRALTHQKWYKNAFPEYPANRKAILPFVI